jgi:hypothetical protein
MSFLFNPISSIGSGLFHSIGSTSKVMPFYPGGHGPAISNNHSSIFETAKDVQFKLPGRRDDPNTYNSLDSLITSRPPIMSDEEMKNGQYKQYIIIAGCVVVVYLLLR